MPVEHGHLGVAVRVAHPDPQQEPVELALGQGIGALVLDRVLGGDHQERVRQAVGHVVDRDLPLLHRLEQGRLGLRRGPVDLVAEHHVGEDPARPEGERPGVPVVDARARHVGGQQVGRELDPTPLKVERAGQRLGQAGLADARHVLEQQVPLGGQAHQGQPGRVLFALEDLGHVVDDRFERLGKGADGLHPHRRLSYHRASRNRLAASVPCSK